MSTAFQLGALGQHIYTFNRLLNWPVPLPEPVPTSFHFRYLTTIALSLSTISFSLACLAHLVAYLTASQPRKSGLLRSVRNAQDFIGPVATAGEILVTTLYFGIKAISRDLVIPDWAKLPIMLDLNLHFLPTILQCGNSLLFSPPRQWRAVSVPRAGGVALSAALAYWVVCERSKATSGMYPYPVMEEVGGLGGRLALFAVSAVLLMGNMVGMKWVYAVVHGFGEVSKED